MKLRIVLVTTAATLASLVVGAAPAAAQAGGGDDNAAVAINTEDGATVFRVAFSARMVKNGVVDQTNTAAALASCTDCQTVALAFQVVLVRGDADVVVPENRAIAYNDQCAECLTYASATQIVLGFDGHVRLTGDARRRLGELYRSLRDLEGQVASMSPAQLHAAVTAAKQELVAILNEGLVVKEPKDGDEESTTTTSTTEIEETTTSTTEADTETTTTSEAETTTTTSATTTSEPTSTTIAA